MSMKTDQWFKGMPTQPGIYLRNNPPVSAVVRQDVFLIGTQLCTTGDGGSIRLAKWPAAATFWWYGPIPPPPTDRPAKRPGSAAQTKVETRKMAAKKKGKKSSGKGKGGKKPMPE